MGERFYRVIVTTTDATGEKVVKVEYHGDNRLEATIIYRYWRSTDWSNQITTIQEVDTPPPPEWADRDEPFPIRPRDDD